MTAKKTTKKTGSVNKPNPLFKMLKEKPGIVAGLNLSGTAEEVAARYPDEKKKLPVTASLLHEAAELIQGHRQQDYGDKRQNFSQTAMLFTGVLAHKMLPGTAITAEDVSLLMIQLKISRLAKSPDHRDSILDVAGYAGCYDMLQQERNLENPLLGATVDVRA